MIAEVTDVALSAGGTGGILGVYLLVIKPLLEKRAASTCVADDARKCPANGPMGYAERLATVEAMVTAMRDTLDSNHRQMLDNHREQREWMQTMQVQLNKV